MQVDAGMIGLPDLDAGAGQGPAIGAADDALQRERHPLRHAASADHLAEVGIGIGRDGARVEGAFALRRREVRGLRPGGLRPQGGGEENEPPAMHHGTVQQGLPPLVGTGMKRPAGRPASRRNCGGGATLPRRVRRQGPSPASPSAGRARWPAPPPAAVHPARPGRPHPRPRALRPRWKVAMLTPASASAMPKRPMKPGRSWLVT